MSKKISKPKLIKSIAKTLDLYNIEHKHYKSTKAATLPYNCSKCGTDILLSMRQLRNNRTACEDCKVTTVSRNNLLSINCLNPDEYIDNKTNNLLFTCSCGEQFNVSFASFNKGATTCNKCSNIRACKLKNITTKSKLQDVGCLNPDEYINGSSTNLQYPCKSCGEPYTTSRDTRLSTSKLHMCKVCVGKQSTVEKEVVEYVQSLNLPCEIIVGDRSVLSPKELDIYIPEFNFAIEVNGNYFHSEVFKDKHYHYNKYEVCKNKGIHLLQISDTEWYTKSDIIKSMISSKLKLLQTTIFARKCVVRELNDTAVVKDFMNTNHLQKYGTGSTVKLGLFYKDKLVSIMLFIKQGNGYNLSRFCSLLNAKVVGGASKLLKYFTRKYGSNIISFSDNNYSDGGLYKTLGFIVDKILPVDYKYYRGGLEYHKFGFRHKGMTSKLDKYDKNISEHDNMLNNGYLRVYDSGKIRWRLN